MKLVINYLKGIVVGIGGIMPGLSGSVLLIILGLYERAVKSISGLFKDFKNNLLFLVPLALGMGTGIVLFSKVADYFLENYEFATRYAFLGLVLGTVPLFYKSVKKEGFRWPYYLVIAGAAAVSAFFFYVNKMQFPTVTEPNLLQSVFLGVAVAGSSIVPGVDSAVILSTLGLYELYVGSVADLNFQILLPAGVGLVAGVFVISMIMNFLIKHCYTITFSVIFGLFLSIIPQVLTANCAITTPGQGVLAAALVIVGFAVSYYLGDIQKNKARIRQLFKKEQ